MIFKKTARGKKRQKKKKEAGRLTEKDIKERLENGWVRCIIIFELAGKPKQHVEETLRAYMENIKRDARISMLAEEYAETEEHEDGIFSTFCEAELLVQNLEVLTWLSINFSPASIEVIEPTVLSHKASELTSWYNDLLSKLHEVSTVLREERSINRHLTESLNALIKNAIKAALRAEERDAKGLEAWLGIPAQQLAPFLKHLVEKKEVVESGGSYRLP
ncbi:hypothetical protein D6789_03620 [Candidatus Woesearchaeota archaeon]|nr:MAG: hypothetical protein D6789_03620 [Candidatus Woesearchaeota archaeon]